MNRRRFLLVSAFAELATPLLAAEDDPRRIVEACYEAIDAKDYRTAYLLWNREGQASGRSFTAFRNGFAETARSRVITGDPTNGYVGMSQRWIDVPVEVCVVLKNGRHQHSCGFCRLHRYAPGGDAPKEAEEWHVYSAHIAPCAERTFPFPHDRQYSIRGRASAYRHWTREGLPHGGHGKIRQTLARGRRRRGW
ncbi:hypothetical protein [Martelella mediterranea]|uniref:SnoaL-like protein n=1 Tax=Martelella mediterranea TaxID=293089 RepID=A0A4R3NCS7_9HYPH|nr:hypothetical protein [Martelella mediterranea]TCT28535.1 hypothetical protein EDC90_10598 [Martelella mediterranea]